MAKKNSDTLSMRLNKRTKKFINKKGKQYGTIKKYHLHLYQKDGHEITHEDI